MRPSFIQAIVLLMLLEQAYSQVNFKEIIEKFKKRQLPFSSKNLKFSFQNCGKLTKKTQETAFEKSTLICVFSFFIIIYQGPDDDPFRILNLNVLPDPIKLPGNITFSGEAVFKQNVTSPITVTTLIFGNYVFNNQSH